MLKRTWIMLLPVSVFALMAPMPAQAQLINGSFEDGNFTGTNPRALWGQPSFSPALRI